MTTTITMSRRLAVLVALLALTVGFGLGFRAMTVAEVLTQMVQGVMACIVAVLAGAKGVRA